MTRISNKTMTPEEADAAYDAAPAIPISEEETNFLVDCVTQPSVTAGWADAIWSDESHFTSERTYRLSKKGPVSLVFRACAGGWDEGAIHVGSPPFGLVVKRPTKAEVWHLLKALRLR